MKKISFIGAFDKIDLILYVAKILTGVGNKVLVLDTTILEKSRFIVPTIAPTKFYVTEHEKIDVAVGFEDIESVSKYLDGVEENYDIVLIDIDSSEKFKSFRCIESQKIYFVTAFDNFSLRKGIQIINNIEQKIRATKVLFQRDVVIENEEYLNLISIAAPVEWEEEKLYFPYDQGDLSAIIENQRASIIRFKNLSEEYRDSLYLLAQSIIPEVKSGVIKKIMKNI